MARLLTMLLLLTALAIPAAAQSYTGKIVLDSVDAVPGASFSVKAWLEDNNKAIAALQLPLKFNNPYLTLDSVSFAGSVFEGEIEGTTLIDPVAKTVILTWVPPFEPPLPYITASNGLLAELFFKLAPGATAQTIKLDSIRQLEFSGGGVELWTQINLSDTLANSLFVTSYQAGKVRVLVPTAAGDDESLLPESFTLSQNYPNPFNPSTQIRFALPTNSQVNLVVYNVLGQEVSTLLNKRMAAGYHEVTFEATDQPSGIYFYRLVYDGGSDTRKMILLK